MLLTCYSVLRSACVSFSTLSAVYLLSVQATLQINFVIAELHSRINLC